MEAVTGVFYSRSDAEGAVEKLRAAGLKPDKVTLLTPGKTEKIDTELESVPLVAAEQSGMGKAIGGVVGAAAGLSGGPLLAAFLPGVGPIMGGRPVGRGSSRGGGSKRGSGCGREAGKFNDRGTPGG